MYVVVLNRVSLFYKSVIPWVADVKSNSDYSFVVTSKPSKLNYFSCMMKNPSGCREGKKNLIRGWLENKIGDY